MVEGDAIPLPSGSIALSELMCLLNTLPVDMTFVDKDDTVKYFSEGGERIFHRPRSIIGRKVQNCHPPQQPGRGGEDPDLVQGWDEGLLRILAEPPGQVRAHPLLRGAGQGEADTWAPSRSRRTSPASGTGGRKEAAR